MNILFGKKNNKKNDGDLVTEANLLCRDAEEAYWAELSKPEDEQDKQLMEECLLLIKESSAVVNKRQVVKTHNSASFALRRIAAIACAVLIFVVMSFGVASAMGLNPWNIFVKQDKNSIDINGQTNISNSASDISQAFLTAEDTNGYLRVNSIKEGLEKIKINPLNLDLTKWGFMIDNIYVLKDSTMIELSVEYTKNDKTVNYCVSAFKDGEAAYTASLLGDYDMNSSLEYSDITFYYAKNGADTDFAWVDGGYVYRVCSSNIDVDSLFDIIKTLYK